MTPLELPAWAKDLSTAERAGRLAVSLPGWRWMPGMLDTKNNRWGEVTLELCQEWRDSVPYPDDPATAGCLLALLGRPVEVRLYHDAVVTRYPRVGCLLSEGRSRHASTLGRACIATAAVLGRWPGGGA